MLTVGLDRPGEDVELMTCAKGRGRGAGELL